MIDKTLNVFSANLKKHMEKLDINNVELSKILGVSESTVGKWTLGHAFPRMGKIQALADYFNISVSELMGEKEQESPEEKLIESIIDKTLDGKIKWIIKNDDTEEDLYNYYAISKIPGGDIEMHYWASIYVNNTYFFNLEIYNQITQFTQNIKRNKETHIEKEKDKVENLLISLAEIIYNRDLYIRQKEEQKNLEMLTGIINSL